MRREKRLICFFGCMLRLDTEDSLRAPAEGCLEGANAKWRRYGVAANVEAAPRTAFAFLNGELKTKHDHDILKIKGVFAFRIYLEFILDMQEGVPRIQK